MLDLKIVGGTIVDGSGKAAYKGVVGVKDGRIVSASEEDHAARVIDAAGKIVCPGFIDAHSHGDKILGTKDGWLFKTAQGITTELCGNCGSLRAPIASDRAEEIKRFFNLPEPLEELKKWSLFENYLRYAESKKLTANVRFYLGHNMLRMSAMGSANRPADAGDLENMRSMLREAMEAGAAGFSTGLIYHPGCFSTPDEIVALAKVIAPFGGIYTSHMRNESFALAESVQEILNVGEQAGVRVDISHFKALGKPNWGSHRAALELIRKANDRGVHATCDQYPYPRNMTTLSTCMPPRYFDESKEAVAEKLKEPSFRRQVRREMEDPASEYDNYYLNAGGSSGVYMTLLPKTPEAEGLFVSEYAERIGKDPWDAYFDLMVENGCRGDGVYCSMCEEDVCDIIKAPFCVVGTDGYSFSWAGKGHPRASASFPQAIQTFVKDKKILTLEEMIHKMTGLTADRLRVANKGLVREGCDADLLILDYDKLKVNATYSAPNEKTEGIDCVIVNGTPVYENLEFTGACTGKVIRQNG